MKQFFAVALTLVLSISFATAQSVDEIAAAYTEAMGGKAKLAALNSVKMSGSMSTQGIDIAMTISKLHLKGMRLDMEIMGSSNYQVGNTSKAFMFMPVMGMSAPEEMPAEGFKSMVNQYDIQGALFNYKEKGNTVVYEGKEKLDDGEAYKLLVTYANGATNTIFIDIKTSRLVKTVSKASMNGQEMENATTFTDFKQNKEGYWFPFSMVSQQGTIVFDNIETNVALPETLFTN